MDRDLPRSNLLFARRLQLVRRVPSIGFSFDASPEEVASSCEDAGHEWEARKDGFRCSGLATDIGIQAFSKLHFCDDRLCRVQAFSVLELGESGERSLKQLFDRLQAKYGKPSMNNLRAPAECRGNFLGCVLEERASWKARWTWPDGKLVHITTMILGGKPAVGIVYRKHGADGRMRLQSEAL